ncbi:MAG: hypothetical protein OJF60_000313 [Burkholderiaceae bacterium]|jgi:hypothetical protein|nr:MAG: hypothetical protein OJF60_000313 [Burkholderiaceae bacterium]
MKKVWIYGMVWTAATLLALSLAYVSPNEREMMGRLPAVEAYRLGHDQPVSLPEALPAHRTLALVAFRHSQKGEVDSWISGLKLQGNAGIAWIRMPVIDDKGGALRRREVQARLEQYYADDADRASLLSVFTDRAAFVRATGVTDTDHAVVLVLDRHGNVLARAQGPYDADRAQALLETLRGSDR